MKEPPDKFTPFAPDVKINRVKYIAFVQDFGDYYVSEGAFDTPEEAAKSAVDGLDENEDFDITVYKVVATSKANKKTTYEFDFKNVGD